MTTKTFMVHDKDGKPLRTITVPENEVRSQLQDGERAKPCDPLKFTFSDPDLED